MEEDLKPSLEEHNSICRVCLTTNREMNSFGPYQAYFMELSGINASESDGLPPWLCRECCMLLLKAVRFKYKLLRAHTMLCDYLMRCAPFPIDAHDEELAKYATPNLSRTVTLQLEMNTKKKTEWPAVVQHEKVIQKSELDEIELEMPVQKLELDMKEELGFSDYEDNITLEEYRANVSKITEHDFSELLQAADSIEMKEEVASEKAGYVQDLLVEKVKKKKVVKPKKKKTKEITEQRPKSSIRKPVELDPSKIRVITLNPEEQVKQREEDSKNGLKFPYQCNLCFKGFNFESKLQNHMTKHSPTRGKFSCALCSMHLPTAYSLSVHTLIHTRRFECCDCGRRMLDRASILHHYRTQHEGVTAMFTCQICGKISNNNKTHRGHMRNHHSGERPRCEQCGKSFINKDSLVEHLQIHEGVKHYECEECGKRFRTRTQIKQHQLKHTNLKQYYCVECDVRFKTSHSLRQHLLKSLKHIDAQSLKGLTLSCLGCPPPPANNMEKGAHVLANHARTHTGEKPFPCAQCGRGFAQRSAATTHYRLVHLRIKREPRTKTEPKQEDTAPWSPELYPAP